MVKITDNDKNIGHHLFQRRLVSEGVLTSQRAIFLMKL